jgi:phage tail-like protein
MLAPAVPRAPCYTISVPDPLTFKRYRLEIDGVVQGGFENAEGLESRVQVIEFQESEDGPIKKKPGPTRYADLRLQRGFVNSFWLWKWHQRVEAGAGETRDGQLVVLGEDGEEIARFELYGIFPAGWKGPPMDEDEEEGGSVEELRLAVDRWERISDMVPAPATDPEHDTQGD